MNPEKHSLASYHPTGGSAGARTPQTSLLLALFAKAKAARLLRGLRWLSAKEGRAEVG